MLNHLYLLSVLYLSSTTLVNGYGTTGGIATTAATTAAGYTSAAASQVATTAAATTAVTSTAVGYPTSKSSSGTTQGYQSSSGTTGTPTGDAYVTSTPYPDPIIDRNNKEKTNYSASEPHHLGYSYNGVSGPYVWSKIEPTCGGKIQSPINIEPFSPDFAAIKATLRNPDSEFPHVDWTSSNGSIANYGHTIKYTLKGGSGLTFDRHGDGIYQLAQFHIHTPSEHRLDGLDYPAELHFVHTKKVGEETFLAVVGGWVDVSNVTTPFLQDFITNSTGLPNDGSESKYYTADYSGIVATLKSSNIFYRYTGSLTTPPCTEGVKWLVARKPIATITWEHLVLLNELLPYTARLTQPLSDPFDGKWTEKRISDYFPENHS